MKQIKKLFGALLMLTALALAVPSAQAQIQPTKYANWPSTPASVTNAATSTVNDGVVLVRKDRGIAILPAITGLGASTANTTWLFDVSADGTNYSTTGPLSYTLALNGTNPVVGFKLFAPTDVNNVRYIRLRSIQNAATNGMSIQRLQYSYFN